VFTEREAAYCRRRRFPAQHLTGRFSVKEAAMKALGTGHSRGVLWRDVEVVRRQGPPELELHGGARRQFDRLGASRALVSITHTPRLAMAHVVLLG
jgi:holo-[acyl-carrier protein] synthase